MSRSRTGSSTGVGMVQVKKIFFKYCFANNKINSPFIRSIRDAKSPLKHFTPLCLINCITLISFRNSKQLN